jgi:hypothetical protein
MVAKSEWGSQRSDYETCHLPGCDIIQSSKIHQRNNSTPKMEELWESVYKGNVFCFFFSNYNYNYNEINMYHGYILHKFEIIFHYQHIFSIFLRHSMLVMKHLLLKHLSSSHTLYFSSSSANRVLGVHPSGGQKDRSQKVLNWASGQDDDGQIQGADFCR